MTDAGTTTTDDQTTKRTRGILPQSAFLIERFRGNTTRDHPCHVLLDNAGELASHHMRQWHAEDASRTAGASAEEVATCKQLIDELNTQRVALVEQIDTWVAHEVHSRADASLHTETLGSVIDRLAIAWVRVNNLIEVAEAHEKARWALRQLAELADSYDDLIRDVTAGQRRLPAWRPLKSYRSTHDHQR